MPVFATACVTNPAKPTLSLEGTENESRQALSENLSFPRSDLLLYVSGEMPAHEASLLELPLGLRRLHPTQVTPPGRTPGAPASASVMPAPLDTILLAAERLRGADTPRQPPVFQIHAEDAIRLQVLLPASSAAKAYAVMVRSSDAAGTPPLQFTNVAPNVTGGSGFIQVLLPPHSLHARSQEVEIDSPQSKYKVRFDLQILPAPGR